MNSLAALFVGLLAGWLLEWFIDWVYWRKRNARLDSEFSQCRAQLDALKQENELLRGRLEGLPAEAPAKEQSKKAKETKPAKPAKKAKKTPDDLQKIKGIGKKISKLLNDNGITTFAELAAISADDLRNMLGDKVKRLADEDDIIRQAAKLAKKSS